MAEYLRYVLRNIEPLRIADDSTSQSGQTVTLRYIPGTTVRGYVINSLALRDDFEKMKKQLFTEKVRFLNAYITSGDRELIPSPKGFYENKIATEEKKELENIVIEGKITDGNKRAFLGRYCYMEDGCIHYYSVDTGSDMKIKMNLQEGEKQNVFRNEYITPHHIFTGYIAVEEEALKEEIRKVFSDTIILGNGRSAGLGKCQVVSCEYVKEIPYEAYLPKKDLENSCYMMFLSNTAMRNAMGEICGLNFESLQKLMGVEIKQEEILCSTSTVEVKGYNRIWGVKIPSVTMFEQGSVFHIKFNGKLTREKMYSLCHTGIGIRKNEGFGRILFLEDYENVKYKQEETYEKAVAETGQKEKTEDKEVLKIAARGYYINKIKAAMNKYVVSYPIVEKKVKSIEESWKNDNEKNVTNSQLGAVESLATAYKYEPSKAWQVITEHFEHALEKEEGRKIHKETYSIQKLKRTVDHIKETELQELLEMEPKKDTVMGISKDEVLSEEEIERYKLQLLISMIRYENKKGE